MRRLLAALSLLAMTAVFFIPAAARWCGWLPRLQLVPAILAGAVFELVILALSVLLFGRLYCSIVCPLGILQDLFAFVRPVPRPTAASPCLVKGDASSCLVKGDALPCLVKGDALPCLVKGDASPCLVKGDAASGSSGSRAKDEAETKSKRSPSRGKCGVSQIVRLAILAAFCLAAFFGFTGLIEPYGIFGRFLAVGVRRVGEPAAVTVVWALGLVVFILAMTFVRARWWCNRICPVGTFLGLFSRFALFRIRIDSVACVRCGACVRSCDKGVFSVRADKSISIDSSSCVACGNCLTACPKGALHP